MLPDKTGLKSAEWRPMSSRPPSPENFEKLIAGNEFSKQFSKHFRRFLVTEGVGNSKETAKRTGF